MRQTEGNESKKEKEKKGGGTNWETETETKRQEDKVEQNIIPSSKTPKQR